MGMNAEAMSGEKNGEHERKEMKVSKPKRFRAAWETEWTTKEPGSVNFFDEKVRQVASFGFELRPDRHDKLTNGDEVKDFYCEKARDLKCPFRARWRYSSSKACVDVQKLHAHDHTRAQTTVGVLDDSVKDLIRMLREEGIGASEVQEEVYKALSHGDLKTSTMLKPSAIVRYYNLLSASNRSRVAGNAEKASHEIQSGPAKSDVIAPLKPSWGREGKTPQTLATAPTPVKQSPSTRKRKAATVSKEMARTTKKSKELEHEGKKQATDTDPTESIGFFSWLVKRVKTVFS